MRYLKAIGLVCLISVFGCDSSEISSDPAEVIGKKIYARIIEGQTNMELIEMLDSGLKMKTGKTIEEMYVLCTRNAIANFSNEEQREFVEYVLLFLKPKEELTESENNWRDLKSSKYGIPLMGLLNNIESNCI